MYRLLAAKKGAYVCAVEPDPDNACHLRNHVQLNGFSDRVRIVEMAATSSPGAVTLYKNAANSGGTSIFGSGRAIRVAADSIDSLDLPSIDVCKIDVEGSEAMVLGGMQHTLARSPNMKLLVEYARKFAGSGELMRFLRAEFSTVAVVGGPVLRDCDWPPEYCNLWAIR